MVMGYSGNMLVGSRWYGTRWGRTGGATGWGGIR